MDFSVPDDRQEFYPADTSEGDGVFLVPAEDVIVRPADNEVIERT